MGAESVSSTLSSTGSCLPSSTTSGLKGFPLNSEDAQVPIIECKSNLNRIQGNTKEGFCSWFTGDRNLLFLSSIEPHAGDEKKIHGKDSIFTPNISTCVVCTKDANGSIQ